MLEDNYIYQYGIWKITSDTDIYDQVTELLWTAKQSTWTKTDNVQGETKCEWQFQDKGKSFRLNYVRLYEECDGTLLDSLNYFAYGLTGKYSVERHGRNKMRFMSSETIGFGGKEVMIKIERMKDKPYQPYVGY